MAKLASLMLFARTLGEELSERCSGKVLLLRLASPALHLCSDSGAASSARVLCGTRTFAQHFLKFPTDSLQLTSQHKQCAPVSDTTQVTCVRVCASARNARVRRTHSATWVPGKVCLAPCWNPSAGLLLVEALLATDLVLAAKLMVLADSGLCRIIASLIGHFLQHQVCDRNFWSLGHAVPFKA